MIKTDGWQLKKPHELCCLDIKQHMQCIAKVLPLISGFSSKKTLAFTHLDVNNTVYFHRIHHETQQFNQVCVIPSWHHYRICCITTGLSDLSIEWRPMKDRVRDIKPNFIFEHNQNTAVFTGEVKSAYNASPLKIITVIDKKIAFRYQSKPMLFCGTCTKMFCTSKMKRRTSY